MADTEPNILSLSTIYDRPKIIIDEHLYAITAPQELTVEQHYLLAQHGKALAELRETAGLSPAQIGELSTHLDAICAIILEPVPAEVRGRLTDSQKLAVTEVFTMLLSEDKLKLAGGTVMQLVKKYLGELPSPGSSPSTAEAPKAG